MSLHLLLGLTLVLQVTSQTRQVCMEYLGYFETPTAFAVPPGNNQYAFIGSRNGEVTRYDLLSGARTTVFDLANDGTTFNSDGESGLLHLTFHPDFQSNRFLYILQSVPTGR